MFTLIDTKYLKHLDPNLKKTVWKGLQKVMEDNGHLEGLSRPFTEHLALDTTVRRLYFSSCPYCLKTAFVTSTKFNRRELVPRFCPFCSEMDPWEKRIGDGLKTAMLIHLADALEHISTRQDSGALNSKRARVLQEQAIVSTATEIEVFMKDAHAILSSKGRRESNRFSNIEKCVNAFKEDLGIDLESVAKHDDLALLDLISAKRNVIVHNSGFADSTFIGRCEKQTVVLKTLNQTPRIRRPIPITTTELSMATAAASDVTLALRGVLEKTLEPRILQKLVKAL